MNLRKPTKATIYLCISVLLAGIVVFGLAGGCASTTLPPKLTPEQRALLHKKPFGLTVGVEEYEFPVYSDGLLNALAKTHLFARVDHLKNFTAPPDIVARIEETIYGSATIPILTGLSLGIIPTTVNETHGYSFSFSPTGGGATRVPIRFAYSGPTTLGWWAVFLNILPNRTMRDVEDHPRFIDSLSWQIVVKRDAIESLHTK
jgi:hypothetical protein